MHTFAALVAVMGLTPTDHTANDEVDLVEINHFYDEQGRLVFDQIIFYDWCSEEGRYNIRDWRLLKNPSQIPLRNWRDGEFVAVWHDFKERDVLRKLTAKTVRETWTQYDPELLEREHLPQEKRRELTKVSVGGSRTRTHQQPRLQSPEIRPSQTASSVR